MSDFLGRKLKYKGAADSTARVVEKQDAEWVELANNQRIPANRVDELFEEVVVDPTAILENTSTLAHLFQQTIQQAVTAPGRNIVQRGEEDEDDSWMHETRTEPVVLRDPSNPNPNQYQQTSSAGLSQQEELLRKYTNQPSTPTAAEIAAQNAEYLRKHGLDPAEDEDIKAVLPEYQGTINRMSPIGSSPAPAAAALAPGAVYQPLPGNSMFGKLKKSYPVQLSIVLEEKIPDLEAIRYMNNLFEESIIDQLASEITYRLLSDPYLLEDMIKQNLELLVYPDRKKKKPVRARKPAAKKTDS